MKILFLCTAHNSLSQRLFLDLSASGHIISIEYALSDQAMIDAVTLFAPELILCPFLTTRVPKQIYNNFMTLVVHPGPPGDAGPSAIDWLLMGDDGTLDDPTKLLNALDKDAVRPGRSHWGVTVLQAIEDFDAGPVWAFDQFPIDIDEPGLTKSSLYRGSISQAAVLACRAAIERLLAAPARRNSIKRRESGTPFSPFLRLDPDYGRLAVSDNLPFQGGRLHHRPLLKAVSRDFDPGRHSAIQVSRRIRSGDSQPGAQSKIFGPSLYLYGGIIEEDVESRQATPLHGTGINVLGIRDDAICIATADGKGVWISHVRRLKGNSYALWPKVPAVPCLMQLGILDAARVASLHWPLALVWGLSSTNTFQEIWVDWAHHDDKTTAYLHFDFYNGAMSTSQCSRLFEALRWILSQATPSQPVHALVLMGGSYFSNGIALNVIEASEDSANESWQNINRIDDVVQMLLQDFPARGILTIAAVRGNAAAGGVALATACDLVIAGSDVVLNPAYRAIGLHGSEFHSLSYSGRCGANVARQLLRSMKPISASQAQRLGLVDYIFPGTGATLDDYIRSHVALLVKPGCLKQGFWKARIDCSPAAIGRARAAELGEMSKDFWSPRAARFNSRRFDFVRKVKPARTPTRFAIHRRGPDCSKLDDEETDRFDDVEHYRRMAEEQQLARLREQLRERLGSVVHSDGGKPGHRSPRLSSPLAMTPLTHHADGGKPAGRSPRVASGMPLTPLTPLEETTVAWAGQSETLFSCYYRPGDEQVPPGATPFSERKVAIAYDPHTRRGSLFRSISWGVKAA